MLAEFSSARTVKTTWSSSRNRRRRLLVNWWNKWKQKCTKLDQFLKWKQCTQSWLTQWKDKRSMSLWCSSWWLSWVYTSVFSQHCLDRCSNRNLTREARMANVCAACATRERRNKRIMNRCWSAQSRMLPSSSWSRQMATLMGSQRGWRKHRSAVWALIRTGMTSICSLSIKWFRRKSKRQIDLWTSSSTSCSKKTAWKASNLGPTVKKTEWVPPCEQN